MPGKTELAIECPEKADLPHLTTDVQIDTKFTGDTGITGTKRLIWSDTLLQSEKIKSGNILQNHQFAISDKTVDPHLQSFQENSSSKDIELYEDLQNNHQLQHGSAIIKNKGTPNLLNSNDNIDGTQTFLTQLLAVLCPPEPVHQKTCICDNCALNHDEICRQCNKMDHFITICPKFLVTFCPDSMRINHMKFAEKYTLGRLLGKGGNGAVYAGFRNSDHFPVAVKVINKNRTLTGSTGSAHRFPLEIALMEITKHIEGVIKLIEYFELPEYLQLPECFVLIMERMLTSEVQPNGREIKFASPNVKDLFQFIYCSGPLKDHLSNKIFRQIIVAIQEMHAAGVLHRDIKSENILIDFETHDVKIIDFGGGARFHDGVYTRHRGSKKCAPPEWFKFQKFRADGQTVWTLGILLYEMACGKKPFESEDQIKKAQLVFNFSLGLSEGVKDLIRACLTVSTERRISLDGISSHPWVSTDHNSIPDVFSSDNEPSVRPVSPNPTYHGSFSDQDSNQGSY